MTKKELGLIIRQEVHVKSKYKSEVFLMSCAKKQINYATIHDLV